MQPDTGTEPVLANDTEQATSVRSFSKLFIGGHWVEPASDRVIEVISPITEEVIATVPYATDVDVDAAVAAARAAFDEGPWPRMTAAERGACMTRVAKEIEARLDEIVPTFTAEVGAPITASGAFHQLALDMWEDAATFHGRVDLEEAREWQGKTGTVVREPVGVVGVVIPWNAPVASATQKIAPALAAGCTVVLKSAEEGPVSIMLMAEALEAAGLPPGVISVLPGGRDTGAHLVAHPDVDQVTFTGSTAAGRSVMAAAADRIARVTLELGGKSAAIIADDIALSEVLPSLSFAGIGHSGQVCAAITRILVPRERQDELVGELTSVFEAVKVGDPMETDTVLGPVVAERQRDRIEGYIQSGLDQGATLSTGGVRPEGLDVGWYVAPTLFSDVTNDMTIAREEIFGPVICVIPFDDLDEAVEIANDSPYGLSGAVYAADVELAEQLARRIRTGQVSINSWGISVHHPFGGYKQSGLGREGGVEGMLEFLEVKLIQNA
jgi:aldehyde dehydrogenase (NAD+)